DGGVVGIGEARHHALGDGVEPALLQRGDGRQDAIGDAALDVGRVAAVKADHHRRPFRYPVAPAVDAYLAHCNHLSMMPAAGASRPSREQACARLARTPWHFAALRLASPPGLRTLARRSLPNAISRDAKGSPPFLPGPLHSRTPCWRG